ncbi:MAG: hypothetical protein ACK44W_10735 [Planctomycetota bacterium]
MRTYERKGWFRLRLPEGWEVDESEDAPAVYRPEGVGVLHVTAQDPRPLRPGERIDVHLLLRAFLRQTGTDPDRVASRRWADRGLEWVAGEFDEEAAEGGRVRWRVWMATNHDLVAFVSYACPAEEADRERADVDAIVGSLELA